MDPDSAKNLDDLRKLFENADTTTHQPSGPWLKSLSDKLYTMFRAPLREEYRREAFKWVASLCIALNDFSWLCPDGSWSKDSARVFTCIAQLSFNEIHLILPLIQRHLTFGDSEEVEDGKLLARSANQVDYENFGNHLVILECCIKSLIDHQNEAEEGGGGNALTDCIDNHELASLLSQLRRRIEELFDYVGVVHRYWLKLLGQRDTYIFAAAEGALRILCIWVSEDQISYKSQCKRFLIDMLVKNILLVDRPANKDLMITGLHSICTHDDEMKTHLKTIPNYKGSLENYIIHVQSERSDKQRSKRDEKLFKLRCGLIKDLLTD